MKRQTGIKIERFILEAAAYIVGVVAVYFAGRYSLGKVNTSCDCDAVAKGCVSGGGSSLLASLLLLIVLPLLLPALIIFIYNKKKKNEKL